MIAQFTDDSSFVTSVPKTTSYDAHDMTHFLRNKDSMKLNVHQSREVSFQDFY